MLCMQYQTDIENINQLLIGNFAVLHIKKIGGMTQLRVGRDNGFVVTNTVPVGHYGGKLGN